MSAKANIKKRGFFNWLFFKDSSEGKPPKIETAAENTMPSSKKWAKMTVRVDDAVTEVERTIFPVAVGRSESPNGITIIGEGVSREHAVIDLQNGILTIVDKNSKNGVLVDGVKLAPGAITPLANGNVIKIGLAEIIIGGFSEILDTPPVAKVPSHQDETVFLGIAATPAPIAEPAPAPIPNQTVHLSHLANKPQKQEAPAAGVFCGECGAQNQEGKKFCKSCGKNIAPAEPAPFCDKCGTKNPKKTKFCGKCGNNLM